MRVLQWILGRVDGTAPAGEEHLFGTTPRYEDLNWTGLDFTREQFKSVTSIDREAWQHEIKLHDELFDLLKSHLPAELAAAKARLEKHLTA
jgi:phosphoenolpyruvate carboxykinase (GTP)